MQEFTLLLIGFSVFAGVLLWVAYLFFLKGMEKTKVGLISCTILLAALCCLQVEHLRFIWHGVELFDEKLYVFLLLAIPPAFYFFSKEVLIPGSTTSRLEILNLLPLLLSSVLPTRIVAPVAFAIGAAYAIWFASYVYGMRRHVKRFRFEMFFFGFFALLATLVFVMGLALPNMDTAIFYLAYANFTGTAMLLIVAALIVFPEMPRDLSDAAKLTYAKSTLNDVDTGTTCVMLETLIRDEKIFQNEDLSLSMLANALGLGAHQLSELINTQYGIGFSRYIREQRVSEARSLLENDSSASILSISLQTGFKSQSNFYAAFREITGVSPGTYRKNQQGQSADS